MKRMYRSTTDKKIAGVCGGIGEMLDIDPTIIRLAAVLICLTTAAVPAVVTYLIAWAIVPVQPGTEGGEPQEA